MKKLFILLLSGCSAQSVYWEKVDDWKPRETQVYYVSNMSWPGAQGFVLRDKETGVCYIIISENHRGNECLLKHEYKHCFGWTHSNYKYNLSCL